MAAAAVGTRGRSAARGSTRTALTPPKLSHPTPTTPPTGEVEGADAGGDAERLADAVGVDATRHLLEVLAHQVAADARGVLHHLCFQGGGGVGW